MDHHASGFVDDNQVFVFVENIQRNILGAGFNILGLRHDKFKFVAFRHLGLGICDGHAAPHNLTVRNQTAKTCAGQRRLLWHIARKGLIKTCGRIGPDHNAYADGRHG